MKGVPSFNRTPLSDMSRMTASKLLKSELNAILAALRVR